MVDMIKDGTGKGYLAKVNDDNQLITRATAVEQRLHSSVDGMYYEASTKEITITDLIINSTSSGPVTLLITDDENEHIIIPLSGIDRFSHAFNGGVINW